MQRPDLGVDDQPAGIEINVVAVQRRELTPPAPRPRRRDHQQPRHRSPEQPAWFAIRSTCSGLAHTRSATTTRDRRPRRRRCRTGLTAINRCLTASLKIIDSSFTQLATVAVA
jgi:hypothetical protein